MIQTQSKGHMTFLLKSYSENKINHQFVKIVGDNQLFLQILENCHNKKMKILILWAILIKPKEIEKNQASSYNIMRKLKLTVLTKMKYENRLLTLVLSLNPPNKVPH
jgi:hypothetical protein